MEWEEGTTLLLWSNEQEDAIDQALRRPGRFDRELEIGVPDKSGRGEILEIHTRDMPISDDYNLDWLLDNTMVLSVQISRLWLEKLHEGIAEISSRN